MSAPKFTKAESAMANTSSLLSYVEYLVDRLNDDLLKHLELVDSAHYLASTSAVSRPYDAKIAKVAMLLNKVLDLLNSNSNSKPYLTQIRP
jgi:hypothetical protein